MDKTDGVFQQALEPVAIRAGGHDGDGFVNSTAAVIGKQFLKPGRRSFSEQQIEVGSPTPLLPYSAIPMPVDCLHYDIPCVMAVQIDIDPAHHFRRRPGDIIQSALLTALWESVADPCIGG